GPDLAEHYWRPGNSVTHDETLRSLTGEGFNPDYLAKVCNQTVEEAWREAQKTIELAAIRPQPTANFDLDVTLRVVDGDEQLADNLQGDEAMCRTFSNAINARLKSV
ncbi:TPA: M3 family metallopeptidase, partial [Yersinia enterocolitica]